MKKKILNFALAICLIIPCMLGLSACGEHVCSWETAWTTNETEHWHKCKDKNCTEVKDKENHTWNDGVIVTEATELANGTKKFTCTVCEYEKTESYVWTRPTVNDADEWNKAMTFEDIDKLALTCNYGNFSGEFVIDGTKIHVIEKEKEGETFVISDEEYYDREVSDGTTKDYCYHKVNGEWKKTETKDYDTPASQIDVFAVFQNKLNDFEYDDQTKEYKLDEYVVNNPGVVITFTNVVFKFGNGKLVEYSWTVEYVSVYDSQTMTQSGEISYDNISVTLPTIVPVDPRKVNENVFTSAVLLEFTDVKYNYQHVIEITSGGLTTNEKIVFVDDDYYYYENEELAVGGSVVTEKYYEMISSDTGPNEIYEYTKSGAVWTKTQLTGDDRDKYSELDITIRYNCYELFAFGYDQFEFDAESGKYVAHNFEQKLMTFPTVELTFLDGRLKEAYWTTSDGATYHATYTYSSNTIEFPEVG